jgi:uncharacterized protein (DUF427 family)
MIEDNAIRRRLRICVAFALTGGTGAGDAFALVQSREGQAAGQGVPYLARFGSPHLKGDAMSENIEAKPRTVKIPGPDHPISVERNASRVVVTVADRVVADTRNALTLREASYPPVQYIPREDVDTTLLVRTDHATYCPYKGDCAYYSILLGGVRSINAVWTYESPYTAVAAIRNYLAFYSDRVEAIEERPGG